jgi:hypothetical protein
VVLREGGSLQSRERGAPVTETLASGMLDPSLKSTATPGLQTGGSWLQTGLSSHPIGAGPASCAR